MIIPWFFPILIGYFLPTCCDFISTAKLSQSVTPEFSKRVITWFITSTGVCVTGRWDFSVSKPLSSRHVKSFLSQLHPRLVSAHEFGVWRCHPACALVGISWCGSTPVRHCHTITWHPPASWSPPVQESRIVAFVFYELFAMLWGIRKASELCNTRQAQPSVSDITNVTSFRFIPIHCRDRLLSRQLHSCPSCHKRQWKVGGLRTIASGSLM